LKQTNKQRINRWRAEALSLPFQPSHSWENAYGVYPAVQGLAYSYLESVDGKVLVIDNQEEDKTLILEYLTRFSEKYRKKVWAKFREYTERYKTGVFLSLTVDPKRYYSLKHAYDTLIYGWHKLHDKVKRILKENYGMDKVPYIRVIEAQENGLPHIHIALMGIRWLMPFKELKELWDKRYNIGVHVDIREIYQRTGVMKYMAKYLHKSIGSKKLFIPNSKFSLSMLICWALNARQFAVGGLSLLVRKTNLRRFWGEVVHFGVGFEGRVLPPLKPVWAYLGSFRLNYKAGIYIGAERLNILVNLY